MKPIPTTHKGVLFRSKLEARWALFFDELGIRWLYEPEGFELSSGAKYLPDFYLPDLDIWAEIKPRNVWDEDLRLQEFATACKPAVFALLYPEPSEGLCAYAGSCLLYLRLTEMQKLKLASAAQKANAHRFWG